MAVIRAGENLSAMLAGAQLGITVCSILLGRIGEPAVAHLLEKPFDLVGIPDALLHTVSFIVAITIVVVLHVLLGEMVPEEHRDRRAGVHRDAADSPVSGVDADGTAVHRVLQLVRQRVAASIGRQPKDELDITVSTVELSEMIAESRSEGLLDPEEHLRLTRALQIRNRVVADVAMPLEGIRTVPAAADGTGPTVGAIEQALADTGYSRFPVTDKAGEFVGFVHIKDVLPLVDEPDASSTPSGATVATGAGLAAAARRTVAPAPQQQSPRAGDATPTAASSRWWRWKTWSRTWSAPCATERIASDSAVATGAAARRGLIWGAFCQGGRVKRRPQPSSWPPLR